MIQSLDQVQVGDFLTCVLGPYKEPKQVRSWWDIDPGDAPRAKERDKNWLGVVVRVTAIQAPVMMVEVYPPPTSTRRTCESYSVVLDFRDAGWDKSTQAYLLSYLNAIKARIKEVEERPKTMYTMFTLEKMYNDLFKAFGVGKIDEPKTEQDKVDDAIKVPIVEFYPAPEPKTVTQSEFDEMQKEIEKEGRSPDEYIDDEPEEGEDDDGPSDISPGNTL